MKKLFCSLMLLFSALIVLADSGTFTSGGTTFHYNILSGTNIEITYTGLDEDGDPESDYWGNIDIPATIRISNKTYTITGIGEEAFTSSSVTTVTIPNTVTTIGERAFYNCRYMTGVTFNATSKLVTIGTGAFEGCSKLTTITIPNSVKTIENSAFYYCSSLATVTMGSNVQKIGAYAFGNCESLTSVTIPSAVTSIEEFTFCGCKKLSSVSFGAGVTSIGTKAFCSCESLTNPTLPSSLNYIGDYAFQSCPALTSVNIPNSVSTLGVNPFMESYNITQFSGRFASSDNKCLIYNNILRSYAVGSKASSFTIPSNVTEIDPSVFRTSYPLLSVTIPSSVTKIGSLAFAYMAPSAQITCENISPSNITLGTDVFKNTTIQGTLFVPKGHTSAYRSAAQWKDFTNIKESEIKATAISLNKTSLSLYPGQSEKLTATITPSYATETVTWTSSNNSVASVYNGQVSASNPGTAIITATCGSVSATCTVTVSEVAVTSVTLSKSSLSVDVGSTATLTATVLPSNATNKTVTWSSSNSAVASVSDGVVSGIKAGTATITASCGGKSATCAVTVKAVAATSVTLNKSTLSLTIGETATLTATVKPDNTTDKTVSWTSSDETIAKVSSNGVVTALKDGTATITAKCGSVSAKCTVTVKPIVASSVTLNKTATTIYVGSTETLTASVLPANTTYPTVTWTTSNEAVATVSTSGVVTAVKEGSATITATCGSVSATCTVTVKPVLAESVTLNNSTLTLTIGGTSTLEATVKPDNTTDKTVTWTSSDEAVATVNTNGVVTAIKDGTATITATCGSVSATCTVTVNPIVATSVTLNKTATTIYVGSTETLTATVQPSNTTYPTVTWTSSNEAVATVSSSGVVTAVKEGSATITATCGSVSATCTVTVKPVLAESVTLNKSTLTLTIGGTSTLEATVKPDNTTDKTVTWTSSDEAVATVNANGVVTAVKDGTATITATCGSVSATCEVTVNPIVATSVTLSNEELSMLLGSTETLTATVNPDNTTDKTIVWTTSNAEVATVENGVVTAVGVGEADIIATANDGSGVSAVCHITVSKKYNDISDGYEIGIEDMVISPKMVTNVPVYMINKDDVTSLELDIHLPDGLALAKDNYGSYAISKTSRLYGSFIIAPSDNNGAVHVRVFSTDNASIKDNEGAIIELPVELTDKSANEGDTFEVLIDNISLKMAADLKDLFVLESTATLTVGKRYTPGDVNGDGLFSAVDVSMIVSYVLGQNPAGGIREAADVNGDGKITAVDVSLAVSYVLSSH